MNRPDYFLISDEINGLAEKSFHTSARGGHNRGSRVCKQPQRHGFKIPLKDLFDFLGSNEETPTTSTQPADFVQVLENPAGTGIARA